MSRLAERPSPAGRRLAALAVLLASTMLAGCHANHVVESGYPIAYQERHPIRVTEAAATHEIMVGTGRGTLNPSQRAELAAFAGKWRSRGTGGFIVEVPAGSANEYAAGQVAREVKSVLVATGVPAYGVTVQSYAPGPAETLAPVRVMYPTVKAEAGPCGIWPDDLGVTDWKHQIQNRPYWNLGCANQKAFAAMIDNPADLVQPRAEQGPYAPRRQTVFDKYKTGQDTRTLVTDESKLSDVGK